MVVVSSNEAVSAGNPAADFNEAIKLEQVGKTNEAFFKYLSVVGGEFAAGTLSMRNPEDFLTLLSNYPAILDTPRARLIQADLQAALGRLQEARLIYHHLATNIATMAHVPEGDAFYFVEPVLENRRDSLWGFSRMRPVRPFTYGPGSHRDNWLLRRLIGAALNEDAANEFARMWDVHRGHTQATTTSNQTSNSGYASAGEDWIRAHPCGFSGLELQFVLDYSYFLGRSGKTNESKEILREALEIMDPDCKPKLPPTQPQPVMRASSTGANQSTNVSGNQSSFQSAALNSGWFPGTSGPSQEDFCRMAYGEFRAVGREADLIGYLQRRIESGANHTRRVLATIRRHRGENDAALELELEFIAKAGHDLLTMACRRGVVFEDYLRMTNAVAEFENALNISSLLQDSERTALETYTVRDRLTRFYTAQGRMEKVLEMEFAQFEIHPTKADDFGQVERMRHRFVVVGQTNQFEAWARRKFASSTNAATRANLLWQLGDFETAAKEAARAGGRKRSHEFRPWLERFEKLCPEQLQAFLTVVEELYPDDFQSRLDLLELKGELHAPAAAACYEQMLQHAEFDFWRSFYPSHLRYPKNPVEAAARLVRVYEQAGRFDDLRALGLKLAQRQPPFAEFEQNLYFYVGNNGRDEFINATLGLAIHYAADKKYQAQLLAALQTSPWKPALAQLERRMAIEAGTVKPSPALPAVKWANVPDGVELFVSCENVRSLAHDDKFVYAGQPWGIAVYDFNGNLVQCIALGESAAAIVASDEGLWVGTPAGLFRLRRIAEGWHIAFQVGRQTPWPDGTATRHGITALALRRDNLWMVDQLGSRLLNTRTLELANYSAEETALIQPNLFAAISEDSCQITLPDRTQVFGRGIKMDCPPYWPLDANRDETDGGLFFVSREGNTNRVSSALRANTLGGDTVLKIIPLADGYWLCTSLGVTRMSARLQVVEQFSRKDGLFGNLVTSAASLGGKMYFGCAWDWRGGGLVEFDPATKVFTSFGMVDGMDANRVEDLGTTPEGELKITYAGETWQQNPEYRLSPPGLFDPKTHRFQSGGPPQPVSQTEAWKLRFEWDKQTLFLGGPLLRKIQRDGKTFYCGTRGMAVVQGQTNPLEFAKLGAVEIPSLDQRLRAAADAFDPRGWTSPEGVLQGLNHTNPYIRAKIICALYKQSAESMNACIPVLEKALDDPFERVRDNAVQLIIKTQGSQALSALRYALANSKLEIRVLAACELAKRGVVPPYNILEDWLKKGDQNVPISQGYDIFNVLQDRTPASMALAHIGSTEAAALCLKYPAAISHTLYRPSLATALGESVRKHPETADIWLAARGRDSKSRWPLPPFAMEVLRCAGTELLPKLHQALTSTNRVIRSNAARACGSIGDASSISPLLAALELESGLSRASIVWALGELKATNAVPLLYSLYTETSDRPSRTPSRAGFLSAQMGDGYSTQYAALQDKSSIAGEGAALLSSPSTSWPADDAADDELLSVDHVLEAIRKIGAVGAQEFYRKLASSARSQDRLEAATQLSNGAPADLATNHSILLALRCDADVNASVAATISLLLLGEANVEAELCSLLHTPDNDGRAVVLSQLSRVPDGKLEFARKEIERIASDSRLPLYLSQKAGALLPKLQPKSR